MDYTKLKDESYILYIDILPDANKHESLKNKGIKMVFNKVEGEEGES